MPSKKVLITKMNLIKVFLKRLMPGEMQESLKTSNNQLRVIKRLSSKILKSLGSISRTIRRRVVSLQILHQGKVNSIWVRFLHGKKEVLSQIRNSLANYLAGNATNCIVSPLKLANSNKVKRAFAVMHASKNTHRQIK